MHVLKALPNFHLHLIFERGPLDSNDLLIITTRSMSTSGRANVNLHLGLSLWTILADLQSAWAWFEL